MTDGAKEKASVPPVHNGRREGRRADPLPPKQGKRKLRILKRDEGLLNFVSLQATPPSSYDVRRPFLEKRRAICICICMERARIRTLHTPRHPPELLGPMPALYRAAPTSAAAGPWAHSFLHEQDEAGMSSAPACTARGTLGRCMVTCPRVNCAQALQLPVTYGYSAHVHVHAGVTPAPRAARAPRTSPSAYSRQAHHRHQPPLAVPAWCMLTGAAAAAPLQDRTEPRPVRKVCARRQTQAG